MVGRLHCFLKMPSNQLLSSQNDVRNFRTSQLRKRESFNNLAKGEVWTLALDLFEAEDDIGWATSAACCQACRLAPGCKRVSGNWFLRNRQLEFSRILSASTVIHFIR